MSSSTLVIADYPIGYASGFGETLYNLFRGFPHEMLWSAHPGHLRAAEGKDSSQSIHLISPRRPNWLPQWLSLAYYPVLKTQQYVASLQTVRLLAEEVRRHAIRNLLVIPVSPWILSAALALHRQCTTLKMVLFVMDDWQGHHESHGLPYTRRRQHLLGEIVKRAGVRFAVSREMATHYEDIWGKSWQVAHNGVSMKGVLPPISPSKKPRRVLLTGDVNIFRFDAVHAFAEALERYNQQYAASFEFTVIGLVAEDCRAALACLKAVRLVGRKPQAECFQAIRTADLLYLPLAFEKRSARISRYSLPTKLPEYLAANKAILFHAPQDSATFRVAERYDLTPRLDTIDPQALDRFVAAWVNANPETQGNFDKAQYALSQEFDMDQLSQTFQAAFR